MDERFQPQNQPHLKHFLTRKGNYNESLSNAEFINQSIAERYGDEIDNYQITNPNDYGVNATNGQRTSEWDKETQIYDNPEALLGTTALAGMGGLALFHQLMRCHNIQHFEGEALNCIVKILSWSFL